MKLPKNILAKSSTVKNTGQVFSCSTLDVIMSGVPTPETKWFINDFVSCVFRFWINYLESFLHWMLTWRMVYRGWFLFIAYIMFFIDSTISSVGNWRDNLFWENGINWSFFSWSNFRTSLFLFNVNFYLEWSVMLIKEYNHE